MTIKDVFGSADTPSGNTSSWIRVDASELTDAFSAGSQGVDAFGNHRFQLTDDGIKTRMQIIQDHTTAAMTNGLHKQTIFWKDLGLMPAGIESIQFFLELVGEGFDPPATQLASAGVKKPGIGICLSNHVYTSTTAPVAPALGHQLFRYFASGGSNTYSGVNQASSTGTTASHSTSLFHKSRADLMMFPTDNDGTNPMPAGTVQGRDLTFRALHDTGILRLADVRGVNTSYDQDRNWKLTDNLYVGICVLEYLVGDAYQNGQWIDFKAYYKLNTGGGMP